MGKSACDRAELSGILIGLVVLANIKVENPYVGALLFSLALLVIIECDLNLYTGKVGFAKVGVIGEIPMRNLFEMLFRNLVGVGMIFFLNIKSTGIEKIIQVAENKFVNNTAFELFIYGMMCGILMFVAVYCKNTVITILCIMTFILSGWEHCIADFPYLCVVFSLENLWKYICIVAGNTFGAMYAHGLLVNYEDGKLWRKKDE